MISRYLHELTALWICTKRDKSVETRTGYEGAQLVSASLSKLNFMDAGTVTIDQTITTSAFWEELQSPANFLVCNNCG